MSYYDYKQQYAYGFGPVALSDLGALSSGSTKFYLGENYGPKANLSASTNDSTHTKPIDFKANKQMFSKKARLDIEVIESFAPIGAKQTVTLTFTGTKATAAGSYEISIKDEDSATVTVAENDTPTDIASAVVTALGALKAWVATSAAGVVTLTKKIEEENITVNSTNFGITGSATGISITSSGFVAGTTGVAPEADGHYIKLDFMSVANATDLAAYIATTLTVIPDMTVYVKPSEAVVCNTPYFQSLMPSNTKEYSWVEISCPYASTASVTFTGGKLVIHVNPNN